MKVILYMAMSVNGYVATEQDETPWSDEEWESYHDAVIHAKAIIIGRRTYELMSEGDDFERIGNPFTIIVTSQTSFANNKNFVFTDTPQKAIAIAREEKFQKVLIGGGGNLNTSFLQQGLVDEMYLDVEPFIFGKGIPLINPNSLNLKLNLLGTKKLNANTIQIHYKVHK